MGDILEQAKARLTERVTKLREAETALSERADTLLAEIGQLKADRAPAGVVKLLEELRDSERLLSIVYAQQAHALERAVGAPPKKKGAAL